MLQRREVNSLLVMATISAYYLSCVYLTIELWFTSSFYIALGVAALDVAALYLIVPLAKSVREIAAPKHYMGLVGEEHYEENYNDEEKSYNTEMTVEPYVLTYTQEELDEKIIEALAKVSIPEVTTVKDLVRREESALPVQVVVLKETPTHAEVGRATAVQLVPEKRIVDGVLIIQYKLWVCKAYKGGDFWSLDYVAGRKVKEEELETVLQELATTLDTTIVVFIGE